MKPRSPRSLFSAALVLFAALALPAAAASDGACPDEGARVVVRINKVRSDAGSIATELYANRPDAFLKKRGRLSRVWVPARAGAVEVCLAVPAPGTYAVAIYHDENDNRRFDKTWLGLPAEGYGVSNNPAMLLGPPSFKAASFEVVDGADVVVDIDLHY